MSIPAEPLTGNLNSAKITPEELPMATANPDFNRRRKALRMPIDALVKRSHVERATVVRILRGKSDGVRFGAVRKVADALGFEFDRPGIDADEFRLNEARRKARLLRRLVQGTMALEAQAVTEDVLEEIEAETVAKLLSEDDQNFWSK